MTEPAAPLEPVADGDPGDENDAAGTAIRGDDRKQRRRARDKMRRKPEDK